MKPFVWHVLVCKASVVVNYRDQLSPWKPCGQIALKMCSKVTEHKRGRRKVKRTKLTSTTRPAYDTAYLLHHFNGNTLLHRQSWKWQKGHAAFKRCQIWMQMTAFVTSNKWKKAELTLFSMTSDDLGQWCIKNMARVQMWPILLRQWLCWWWENLLHDKMCIRSINCELSKKESVLNSSLSELVSCDVNFPVDIFLINSVAAYTFYIT